MAANQTPKLLPARARITQALQQATSTPFTKQQMAAVKEAQQPKKKKSAALAALQQLTGAF
jgi:hypothetical protein